MENNFDWVLNLCLVVPKILFKNPLDTASASIKGIYNILDFCLKNNSQSYYMLQQARYMEIHMYILSQKVTNGNVNTVDQGAVMMKERCSLNASL